MNKMEDLRSMIADNVPDIIMITEVIPKAQKHPIQEPLLNLPGFEKFTNFKFTEAVCDVIAEAVERKDTHLLICRDFNYPEID